MSRPASWTSPPYCPEGKSSGQVVGNGDHRNVATAIADLCGRLAILKVRRERSMAAGPGRAGPSPSTEELEGRIISDGWSDGPHGRSADSGRVGDKGGGAKARGTLSAGEAGQLLRHPACSQPN